MFISRDTFSLILKKVIPIISSLTGQNLILLHAENRLQSWEMFLIKGGKRKIYSRETEKEGGRGKGDDVS